MDHELTYDWIRERLADLHSGRLTETEKARLREAALQDPFVADALEGFEAHPDADHSAVLTALAAHIQHHRLPRRRWLIPNLAVTAIAASFIILVAAYAVLVRMHPSEKQTEFVLMDRDSFSQYHPDSQGVAIVFDKEEEPADPPVAANTPAARSRDQYIRPEDNLSGSQPAPAAARSAKEMPAAPDDNANPFNPAFEAFMKAHSRYPLSENKAAPGHTVEVEFEIDINRRPEDIKVLSSPDDKRYADEALRLLRDGPAWECHGTSYPCKQKFFFYFN